MAQETHNSEHHPVSDKENKSLISSRSSFWFVIILVCLFIAALNFINVMSNDNGEGNPVSEQSKPIPAPKDATSSQTLAGENGNGKTVDSTLKATTGADTFKKVQ